MRLTKLFLTAFIVFLFSSNTNSAIEPIEDLSFTIPGLSENIEQFVLNDINSDGMPEILATDGSILVLYSITNDSILFTDTIPTSTDTLEIVTNYKILFDDVNRDSIPDILFSSYFINSDYWGAYPILAHCEIIFYDGNNYNNSQIIDLDPLVSAQTTVGSDGLPGNLNLMAVDINGDNHNELIISFETIESYFDYSYTYSYVKTDGSTILYYSFPDSISLINHELLSNIQLLPTNGNFFITNTHYSVWSESHGSPTRTTITNKAKIFDSNFIQQTELFINKDFVIDCGAIVSQVKHTTTHYKCIGNINTNNSGLSIISKNYWYQSLYCYGSPMFELDSSGSAITLQNFIAPDSLEEIWTLDITDHNYTNFLYHPLEPGYFFAFEGDTLLQFKGTDGSIYQRNDTLPTGILKWVYPFNDNLPRLSITEGNTIKLYRFDISTGVDNLINPNNLPTEFTLLQNYPNPFNPSTVVEYSLPSKGNVKAEVYNILGQKVVTLIDKEQAAGHYQINWDASNQSSGIYLVKVSYDDQTKSIKTMLLK